MRLAALLLIAAMAVVAGCVTDRWETDDCVEYGCIYRNDRHTCSACIPEG